MAERECAGCGRYAPSHRLTPVYVGPPLEQSAAVCGECRALLAAALAWSRQSRV